MDPSSNSQGQSPTHIPTYTPMYSPALQGNSAPPDSQPSSPGSQPMNQAPAQSYPGAQPIYQPAYPGAQAPYPGAYPGAQAPYLGAYPGASGVYPGAQPVYAITYPVQAYPGPGDLSMVYPTQVVAPLVGVPAARVTAEDPTRDANGLKVGHWEAGICSCCDSCYPNCLMACCCPCFSIGRTVARLGLYKFTSTVMYFGFLYITGLVLNQISGGVVRVSRYEKETQVQVSPAGIIGVAIQWACLISLWTVRYRVRNALQIPGNCCGDCLCSYCCVIAQMATQTKSYSSNECSFGPPDVLPGYK